MSIAVKHIDLLKYDLDSLIKFQILLKFSIVDL
jgi:hypothetical protein